ncbi:MAG: type II secretion system F family protein [Actinobacteria bacterium]|nr:type II secretion system F family protein [Actinomycetota bacterium]
MNAYKYNALTTAGTEVTGVVEAYTQDEAIAKLKSDYDIIVQISATGSNTGLNINIGGQKVNEKSLSLMCNQFGIILGSGLPIVRTVELVAEQTSDKVLKSILLHVADDISAGYGLADSFVSYGKSLPTTFVETIRAGEESGNLQEVFIRLSTYFEKKSRTKGKVISAMMYPAFVMVVAVVVVAIIMLYAVPAFSSSFANLGVELPFVTKALIATAAFMKKYIIVILAFIALAIVAAKLVGKTNGGKTFYSRAALKLPIFGRINRMNAATQYASTMSIMLTAGLSIIKAVDVTARSMSNYAVSHELSAVLGVLEAGKRLGFCLTKIDAFPDLIAEMTSVGEDTGSLETTLGTISEYYDNEVQVATERALAILEPTIIVFLAVFVVLVLLSVYIPMFSMYGSM